MRDLEAQDVEAFFERGFVLIPDVFSDTEVAEMRSAFERLEREAARIGRSGIHGGSQFVLEPVESGGGATRIRIHRIVWCGAAEPVLSTYGRDPRLLRMAAAILGCREMSQLINQAHFKFPDDGVAFPWHQDSSHRRYGQDEWRDLNGRGSYVQTVTAIDDVTEENGPLLLIPGSCRLGHLDLPPDGTLPEGLIDPAEAVRATMRAGSVLVFGPYVVHSSRPNRSARPRRAFINGFAYPGANSRVYPGEGAGRLLQAPE